MGELGLPQAALDSYARSGQVEDPIGGPKGALLLWEPEPSIFPSGMTNWIDLPLFLHNRYFARENNYTAMGYEFLYQDGVDIALPVDKGMWKYLMGKAKDWGMGVYEQVRAGMPVP